MFGSRDESLFAELSRSFNSKNAGKALQMVKRFRSPNKRTILLKLLQNLTITISLFVLFAVWDG